MKKVVTKKPSKGEAIALSMEQDFVEQDGCVIRRQRSLLQCQVSILEAEIADFSKKIADARRTKSIVEAQIVGLGRAIARRRS